MQIENSDKPGMGCPTDEPNGTPMGPGQPGASPRGPRRPAPYPLPTKIDIRLTDTLRTALRKRALADGITDSACARRILLDALDVESDLDRKSGVYIPPEELNYATKMLANLTTVILASRGLQDGQAGGVIAAMEAQHARLVDIIGRMER